MVDVAKAPLVMKSIPCIFAFVLAVEEKYFQAPLLMLDDERVFEHFGHQ
jgi:hypothetical protein